MGPVGETASSSSSSTAAEDVCGTRTVVVGVMMDAQSRELLTWALVKVAQSGDRVIALHVLPNSTSPPSSLLSLISAFDSVLSVYHGFCNLKQIDLKLKVCRGSSLRRALVREAAASNAAHLILGVSKGSHGIGFSSSVSIAKYCAKRVPGGCGVAAVSNGKIIFERQPSQPTPRKDAGSNGGCKRHAAAVLDVSRNDNLFCLLPHWPDDAWREISIGDGKSASGLSYLKDACSICSEVSGATLRGDLTAISEVAEEGEVTLRTELPQKNGSRIVVTSESVQDEPGGRQRWLAVRRSVVHERKLSLSEKTGRSVFQWAMRFPTRYSAFSAIHPDRKLSKTEKNDKRDIENEKGTDNACSFGVAKFSRELKYLYEKYASVCRFFTFKELSDATNTFCAVNVVGKGGSSCVYKGCLYDGRELAVKVLKQTEDNVKEFAMEMDIITSLSHRYIISLVGFSFDNVNLFLVYDLFSRGSLDHHLHELNNDNGNTLGWDERYKIAIGVAEALDYLHGGCGQSKPAIHRDVKSSNILLSEDFEPQLCDFGFAAWGSSSSSIIACTNVAGTFGYLAPEYFLFGKVNEKIDVYAFGVVILELLTGRKPIGKECPKGQESLVIWVKPLLQAEKTKQLLDPRLGIRYDAKQVEWMILAANLCTRRAPKLRPKMSFVLKLLLGDEDTVNSARLQVKASEELEGLDDDTIYPVLSNIESHLSLALLDAEDDASSLSSSSHSI